MAGLKSKRVGIYLPSCDEIAAGTCLGVNDKGVTLDIDMSEEDAEGSKLIPGVSFIPWGSVGYIHIPGERSTSEPRSAMDHFAELAAYGDNAMGF